MTQKQIKDLMDSSQTEQEWIDNAKAVAQFFPAGTPSNWYLDVLFSENTERILRKGQQILKKEAKK